LTTANHKLLLGQGKQKVRDAIGWGKGKWRKVDSESKAEIGKEMQREDGRFSRHMIRGGSDRCRRVDLDTNKH